MLSVKSGANVEIVHNNFPDDVRPEVWNVIMYMYMYKFNFLVTTAWPVVNVTYHVLSQ